MAPVVRLTAPGEPAPPLRRLPMIVRLDLAELLVLAERCGSPRLPLDLDDLDATSAAPEAVAGAGGGAGAAGDPLDRLQDRLAGGAPSPARRAHGLVGAARRRAAEEPDDVARRLAEVGLLDVGGTPHGDAVAALAVLAAPEAMIVLDLAVRRADREERLRSFHAVRGDVVAQLATATGLDHELAWYGVAGLAGALTRAATLDDGTRDDEGDGDGVDGDDGDGDGHVPVLELPFEVFTDGTEAVRRGREDLLAEVLRLAPAPVRVDGAAVSPTVAAQVVTGLETATTGRLRVLVSAADADAEAAVGTAARRPLGIVTWLRTATGWRGLTATYVDGVPVVRVAPVAASDLARAVAPVLAQVVR